MFNRQRQYYIFRQAVLAPLIAVIILAANSVSAVDGILINYGVGMNDTLIQNKSISDASQKTIGVFWKTDTSFKHDIFGYSELEFEGYVSHIEHHQSINIFSFRPVLSFWNNQSKETNWYWQLGAGLSYIDSKNFSPVDLSSNGQFALMFGIGMPLDKNHRNRLTLRYNHYSNGYLARPNHGIDTFSLDWHYQL